MDYLHSFFTMPWLDTYFFLPPLIAFVVSYFSSMAGISGAFLLLPVQMSFFHNATPSASSTNFVYNIIATPGGVYRYIREGRMAWPLAWVIIAGTLPGLLIGYFFRVRYLPDIENFQFFVGCVLMYVGIRLFYEAASLPFTGKGDTNINEEFRQEFSRQKYRQDAGFASDIHGKAIVRTVSFSLSRAEYEFQGESFSFSTPGMFGLAFIVGIIGGIYGIGGGAIIAPFCITFYRLPVYTVAGASLFATFLTSVAGVIVYSVVPAQGITTAPNWQLGILFGAGGLVGMYLGALSQKFFSQKFIKLILGLSVIALAVKYVASFFMR